LPGGPGRRAPTSAEAATVELRSHYDRYRFEGSDAVIFRAAPREANNVEVVFEGEEVVVTDRVPLVAGPGCAAEGATAVRCTRLSEHWHEFKLFAGDRDDRVNIRIWHPTMLFGGPGDDRLVGSRGQPTRFHGGAGRDMMIGGSHIDIFLEGRSRNGSDTMISGNKAAGDAGPDQVSYFGRRSPVRADLDGDRDDGAPGEQDRIGPGVGTIVGGHAGDVLLGGPGANTLDGWDGSDILRGGTGDDVLDGGNGRDTLRGGTGDDTLDSGVYLDWDRSADPDSDRDRVFGGPGIDGVESGSGTDSIDAGPDRDWIDSGPGDDRIVLHDGDQDLAECGAGRDTVRQDGMDFVMFNCERHGSVHPQVAMPVAWTDASDELILDMVCPFGRTSDCTGQVTIDPGPPVPPTTQPFAQPPGSLRWLRIPLSGRSFQSPVPPLEPAVVEVSSTDAQGRTHVRRVPLAVLLGDWPILTGALLDHVSPTLGS
jgi:hypothetical protein